MKFENQTSQPAFIDYTVLYVTSWNLKVIDFFLKVEIRESVAISDRYNISEANKNVL